MKNTMSIAIRVSYWLALLASVGVLLQIFMSADHQLLLIPFFGGGFVGWLVAKIFRANMLAEQNKGVDKSDWDKIIKKPLEALGVMGFIILIIQIVILAVGIIINVMQTLGSFYNMPLTIVFAICTFALMLIMSTVQIIPVKSNL